MAVAQKIGAQRYLECSAKSGQGVREVFEHATRYALLAKKGGSRRTRGKVVSVFQVPTPILSFAHCFPYPGAFTV